MNAIYSCCILDVWLETARQLKEKMNIECKYFIGWKDDLSEERIRELTNSCHCQYVEDAWRGLGFPSYVKVERLALDESTFSKYAFDIWTATKMIDRLDPTGEKFSFSERTYWIISQIEAWLQVIDNEKIDIVISPSIPHRVFDYTLYIAAKIRDIKFIMFQMTPFGDKSFIIDNVNATPNYIKRSVSLPVKQNDILPKDIEERIGVLLGSYENAKPDYMVRQKHESQGMTRILDKISKLKKIGRAFRNANTYRVIKKNSPSDGNITLISYNAQLIRGEFYKRKLKTQYRSLVDKCSVRRSKSDKYILVALHYQPEETSCPTGGMYSEQRQIVKIISSVLPENYKIYVKEHTSQFHPKMEGEAGRALSYYEDLLAISNRVVLINDNEDTFSLIDGALATVTVSGTIGWESVFRGTPSILFGRAWYEDMPGVYKVKDKRELKLVIDEVTTNRVMPSSDELISYHKILNRYLIPSSHYKATADKNLTNKVQSAKNLSQAIVDYLA